MTGRLARARRHRDDERGASALELVLYMPLLMLFILLAVQFTLVYLGNSTASAVARETARVVRATQDPSAGYARGAEYANNIAHGTLNGYKITIAMIRGGDYVTVTVSGRAQEIVPGMTPTVTQTVTGPIEKLR